MATRTESGAAGLGAMLLVAVTGVALAFASGATRAGGAASARARADAAADLVALAAVVDPASGAGRVARANGATVVRVDDRLGGGLTVQVRRGGVVGEATARPAAQDRGRSGTRR